MTPPEITPEEYEREIFLAKQFAEICEGSIAPLCGPYYRAKALLHAHSQRRTVGTREVCLKHSIWQNEPDSPCINAAMAARECSIADCPLRSTGKE